MSWEEPNDSSCWFFFGDNEVMKMNTRPKKNVPIFLKMENMAAARSWR